ncbi:MAG TPA: alpha/beta fold hydrolase [Candidatus Corynebacterium gallistercoris]|uniref:Alpha/beta fold hydrolase n=1 Tax=Candidatus Corynebacterium gallistercoris TaxID=2838530 RepID=A0A9D1RWT0_9CORY|nr:alpha/beta fold hydrolase [Candidatus Corynebacterium gallistercoris]
MADASTSSVRVFGSGGDATPTISAHKPLVVIWPGFGMGARYYDPIAWELCDRGYPVATGELRGQGTSTARASRSKKWGYHDLASGDYPRTIKAAKEAHGLDEDHPVVLLCHSMGGQIASLFIARPEAAELNVISVMGVGAGSPYWEGFNSPERWRLRYGTYLVRATVALLGYQPAGVLDVAGYGRQAGPHLREWFRYAHTNRLMRLRGADMDYEAARREASVPVLLTRFVNDGDCPLDSAKNLAADLPQCFPRVEELPEELGHNRWAREPGPAADRLEEFVREIG